jgi:hypothetical protein
VVAVLLVKRFVLDVYPVSEQSMWPTLEGGRDLVAVDKLAAIGGTPGRFELWVFRRNGQLFVKRLLGLPGEVIDFRGGDLWVARGGEDPARASRPPALVEALRVRVPPGPALAAFEARHGRVEASPEGFAFVPDPGATMKASLVAGAGAEPLCIRDDHLATNGRIARGRHAVPDVRVTLGRIREAPEELAIVHELEREWRRVAVDRGGIVITARDGGADSERARFPGATCRDGIRLETLDGTFRVSLKDGAAWRELFSEPRDTITPGGFSGVRIEVAGGPLRVDALEVTRDVHYVWGAENPQPIPSDRLFLVGDNPEISTDSRDPGTGLIPRGDLVGLVRAVVWPWARKRFPD